MKTLIIAYACEPGKGGESEIGWTLARKLAKDHQVWVLTRSNNKSALESEDCGPNLKFLYYDLPRFLTATKGRGKKNFLLYYYLWQLGSSAAIRRFDKDYDFDIIHHLTGGMDWMPSGAAFQKKPFIWGPVGSENTHPLIRRHMPWRAWLKDLARSVLRSALRSLDPNVRRTRARADVILSHTPGNFPASVQKKVMPFVQTGIEASPRLALQKTDLKRNGPLRVIYAGELVDWKGALLAVKAFAKFHVEHPDSCMTMVGAGNLEGAIKAEIQRNDLGDVVSLTGKLPMDRLLIELNRADIFLYPSYHHGLATILLQAMLTGLPTICLEGDAIGRAVGQEAGITLPPPETGQLAGVLSRALLELAENDALRQRKAQAAIELALNTYNYDDIVMRHTEVYWSLVGNDGKSAGPV
ncbi:glycosyltransferase family 4 protein [Shimia haliotis]|uniref:Glycosyltransferase involved in cell wall bisynthesis n=1 Tax=Shimia haliotis TaxID=1280847 RepID=A0A1I4C6B2_9RHOB|nr:glycosyltransferase family 4 protein [Shimia haliotis]SFK75927.1 Glycosyltransferase involved in cell wall bisynthesis [Shimia haliotis]